MAIEVKLDLVLVLRKMKLTELSEKIGISVTNLSLLKTGKVKGMRFSTLQAICEALHCQPGDILEYVPDSEQGSVVNGRKDARNSRGYQHE